MYDQPIVTYNKSNRLKDLPKREQDKASGACAASKSDEGISPRHSPNNILGGEYKPKGMQNRLAERSNPQERSH